MYLFINKVGRRQAEARMPIGPAYFQNAQSAQNLRLAHLVPNARDVSPIRYEQGSRGGKRPDFLKNIIRSVPT